jgi:hypothetical protein
MGRMLALPLPAVKKGQQLPRMSACDSPNCPSGARLIHCLLISNTIKGAMMTDRMGTSKTDEAPAAQARRVALKRIGRFALVSAPVVTLLLAAGSKPSQALPCSPCAPSSRSLKNADGSIDTGALLAAVAALPIAAWHDKTDTGRGVQPHVGPFAGDFQAAFGVGDGVTINPTDAIGVCLTAIQALSQKIESLEAQLNSARRSQAA